MTASHSRRWLALVAMVPASLVIGIDSTVLALALPTLATKLNASTSELQWFVSAYMLVFAAAMIPAGLLADRYGRKKILLIALVVLGVGSVACAYSGTSGQFMAARVLQAFGAAMVIPGAIGALPALFTEAERPKAVAALMAATMLGQPIGPLLGGWLLTSFWWGSVFIINVPVVLIAIVAVVAFVPESRSERKPRFDVPGIVLSSGGFALLIWGVIRAGETSWGNATALATIGAGAVVLAVFALWERHVCDPLVDLRLFRSPGFTWGTALATLVSFSMMGVMFAMPLYFQEVLGYSAFGNGLRQLPLIAGLLVGAVAATRIARLIGDKLAVAVGFAILAVALGLGALTHPSDGSVYAMTWLTVAGLGLGVSLPTTMNAAIGALSPEHGGVGSALIQALRMVGGAFGAAIIGSILNAGYRGQLHLDGLPAQAAAAIEDSVAAGVAVARQLGSADLATMVRDAFVHGMAGAYWACAAAAVAGVVLALVFMPRRSHAVADAGADARTPGDDGSAAAVAGAPVVSAAPAEATAPSAASRTAATSPATSTDKVESGHEGAFAVE
jgi:MFS transporter, DHA2 family, multidrug resistance protein